MDQNRHQLSMRQVFAYPLAHDTWSLIGSWAHRENLFKESNFQLFSYSIDHFHVPKFDSNGFCWMNIEDLYWRDDDVKSDKIAKNDKFSRELVCNFDGQGFTDWYTGLPTRFNSLDWKTLSLNPLKDVTIQK